MLTQAESIVGGMRVAREGDFIIFVKHHNERKSTANQHLRGKSQCLRSRAGPCERNYCVCALEL